MRVQMKRWISLILAMVMVFTMMPMQVFATEQSAGEENPFAGKKVSILSHSMSTYAGVSNNTSANSTIGKNDVYYTEGRHGVYLKDTWWMQTIDALDMELLVNNSWSGSCVFQPRKGEASVGYGDRAVNLHNDHTGEEPDIIFVYLGCNDFAYFKDTFGTADSVSYDAVILDNGDGTYTYAVPTTACEAYAIMLHKVANRYPNAEIYCMTSTARREVDYTGDTYPDAGQPTAYVAELQKIANYFGFPVVDLENAIPKDVEIFDKYIGDKRAHANALGMDQITNALLSVMLGKEAEIGHVTADHGAVEEQAVLLGGSYNAKVNIPQGYSVVVTMSGQDVTADVYQDGEITIGEVTGDIHVETVINRDPQSFRWEFRNDTLTSVGSSDNVLTKLSGTVANNILNDVIFQLNTPVILKHDLPWAVEWKCAEDWRGVMLTSHKESATKGMTYLSRVNGGQLCFGTYTGSQYDNYGVDISGLSTDTHTYRLENRMAADGSNMVWLYVDGEEVGPMNNYFIGSKDQNKTSDWVSGKDFVFSFIGMTGHALRNCQLDYLSIQEGGHTHSYKNGICTGCGEEDPDGLDLNGLNVLCLGDSITAGQGLTTATRWTNVLASKYNWNLTNKSQGGISLSSYYYTANGTTDVSIAKKAEVLKTMTTKPDVIIVWGGHNDTSYRHSPLGTWDDETTDSFKGALKYIAKLAHEYAPDATLFVLTPLWNNENPSTLKVPSGTTDTNWMFVDAIYEGAEKYGWIPINMDLCGITPFTKSGLLLDNIHPNAAGTELIVEYLSEELASYGENSKKETIIFNQSSVSVKPGESTTLKGVLSPRSGTGTMTFTWSSSNPSVATVDANGKITAVAHGTAIITATATNGTSAGVSISVACDHTYENGVCTGCGATIPNPYVGKTIACVGDSITCGVGVTAGETDYVTLLAKSLGMEYIRLGASGTTLCTGGHRTCNLKQLTEAKLAGADVVTILMGINDFDQAKEGYYTLGTIDSTDTSTIYGAVHMWCQRIEELRKTESLADTEFYFLTPVITAWNHSVSAKNNWDQSKTTIHGYTLRDLCNAIIEVCALYDVPVIDLNLISGIYYNSVEDNNVGKFGNDGIHPGANGHAMMAFALENALLKNNLKDDHTHTFGSWITTTYPGCYQGEQKNVCSVCSATESRQLDALGHTYENGICTGCGDVATLAGKTLSILGASISTYTGISNNTSSNATIGKNAVYYTEGRHGVYANDTWWMQAANDLGLRLLVNNSWSGSALLHERNGTVGAYVNRCVQLHNNQGEEPDIIAIQMGSNDFQYYKDTLGTAEIDYAALIKENADGTFTYATPVTSLEAAAIVLHKISVRYPNAEVYYLNVSQRVDNTDELIRFFNGELKQVVEHFGASIVDIYGSAITMEDFDTYIGDGKAHPNKMGMDAYTEAFKRALVANTNYAVTTHTVSMQLDDVTADYGDDRIVVSGDSYALNLAASDALDVTVIMGGQDITQTAYHDGKVTIDAVTADVVITAKSVHQNQDYRWEFNGTDLAGENTLTKISGTTTDGVFSNTCYALEKAVVLYHDQPWIVEWKCEGTFLNSASSTGARVFSSTAVNAEYNARSIFKSNINGLVTMGEKTTTGSHNYGIALGNYGIDWTALHTYRLENRIAENGSNMVYLFVDGREIGPMNHYYVGTTDQNTTSDWLSGKDFVFPYMGTDTHGFTNAAIEFIAVWEAGHTHTYENGICTGCGEADPDAAKPLDLRYDDHYDVTGKTVEIIDAGESVLAVEGNYLVATGIGRGKVRIDGTLYEITVEKAKINIVVIMGQSNAGNHFVNATSDVTCPLGTAYWWKNGATEPVDYTQPSMGFHTPLIAELYAQSVTAGDPVKNVMVWQEGVTSKNGQSIVKWAATETDTSGTDGTATMIKNCIAYYEKNSDLYEIVNCGVYWLQGESDVAMSPEKYTGLFMAMWNKLKEAGAEYVAFFRVRKGTTGNDNSHHDLSYTGSLTAQLNMINSNPDMFMATTITENWVGDATTEHSVDISNYMTLVEEYGKDSDYNDDYGNAATIRNGILTTTMKTLYGSNNRCHYGKFGYGIIGADAAYNMHQALHSDEFAFVMADTSGEVAGRRVLNSGESVTVDITDMTENLAFRAACGSTAGTLAIKVSGDDRDITANVIAKGVNTFGTVDVAALREYDDVNISVTYTLLDGTFGSANVEIIDNTPDTEETYLWDFNNDLNARDEYGEVINGFESTALKGSYTLENGLLKGTDLQLELQDTIRLSGKKNWSIEWKFGAVDENSRGFLLCNTEKSEIGTKTIYLSPDGKISVSDYADSKGYRNFYTDDTTYVSGDVIRITNRFDPETKTSTLSLWKNGNQIVSDFGGQGNINKTSGELLDMSGYALSGDFVINYLGCKGIAYFSVTNEIDYIKIVTNEVAEPLALRYDDHYDVTGKTVEIIDAGKPTSYQVGYGVEENKVLDTAVVTLEGNYLVATGIGTAKVKIDGVLYEVTVTAAPISLLLLIGQSNMQGIDGNPSESIVCATGQVYATYADRYKKTVEDVTKFAPSALTGEYQTVNVTGDNACLENYPVNMLTEAGNGREGMDSGIAYEWTKQTGEKVWTVNVGYGGSSIKEWQEGGVHYLACLELFKACQDTLRKEIAAGHFTLSHMAYFWCQGCADENQTAEWYVDQFLTMHDTLKSEMAFDEDTTFEFAGIVPIRSGHNWVSSYRAGVYKDTTNVPYYQSFKDLQFNGPRVAQYWMGNNPELTDIWNVCTIQEGWATLPDGTDGVTEYFESAYKDGIVDYPTQVKQSASWYRPTTPEAVHDNIHYNQIGYNELGRESARNALIMLGILPDYDITPTVKFLSWDGFTPAETVTASTTGVSGTLVVPMVYPVSKSKDVTYTVTDGLRYEYYDLLAESVRSEGVLAATGAAATVAVEPRPLTSFRWELDSNGLVSNWEDDYDENAVVKLAGSVAGGVFSGVRYKMDQAAQLLHNEAWCVEIQLENWIASSGTMILSSSPSAAVGAPYIYFRPADFFVGIGCYNGSTYDNYGVSLKKHGITCSEGVHTYQFVNRVSDDGTNMIYLIVDNQEIGALTDHYINSTLTDKENTWLSGQDFAMPYLGTTTAPISNCTIHYIVVTETNYNPDMHLHDWSDWEMVSAPSVDGPGEEKRVCAGCDETQIREVEGVWQTHSLSEHMVPLPEKFCSGTNLWKILPHDAEYYHSGIQWAKHESGSVYSVTIEVNAGDKIFATSFGKYAENGNTIGTSNGIRVTFFDAEGVLKTMAPQETYAEFAANGGYIVAPEGTVAINIPMYGNSDSGVVYILNREHCYENGICTGCGKVDPNAAEPLALRYDDHYDVTGKTVEIIDAGKPTSYQVGYGVEENKILDTAVVTLEGNYLVATGIGTAKLRIDGVLCEVTVTAAPISLLLLIGQSNMRGSEGNANQSIVCPDGMVYSTYGDDRGESNTAMTVSNATRFAPSALTGTYSSINVAGTTDCLSGYPVYSLTEAGAGKIGPDSGFAYEWVKQTGEKVWVVNAAHGGTSINVWQPGTTEYEQCQALFTACQETLRKEIAAGHFTLSHMAYFWCQGCSDRTQSAQWYVNKYLAMHSGLKTEMSFDHDSNADTADKTFEFGGIIPVRVGSTATCYRDGAYSISNPYAYHESFVDLRFNGPRVAQYWMINNPELSDIWGVCDIGDNWVWMPDGTNGVTEYFQSHYENGTVDYTTQVKQSASWYTPTTPKAVHDSIHYNQIGYNEYGREAVRNALIMLGEIESPDVETTVELLSWDGYTPVEQVTASTAGNSGTLVVPKVYPIWKSKDIAYELSEGLTWDYYDLLAADVQTEGTLTAGGQTVCVAKAEPGVHYVEHLSELPEDICCGLNLWPLLEHESEFYYGGTHWAIHGTKDVRSVTIPVIPGDKIFATAFGKAGQNGHETSNGIRVTFFSEYGVAKTMAPAECYAEFTANGGYLVAPENATAINVVMWNNSDENELYLLDRAHDTDSGICGICGKDSHIHSWSGWQMKEIPGKGEPVTEERVCSGCGETETREVESVWQKYDLAAHYSDLPENVCSGLNLWNMLEHDKYYFASGTNWSIYSGGTVKSVTISVEPGDKIFATAFGKAGQNGHATSSGIRVTFFSAYGVAKTMAPAECYAEFSANGGYLVAPENAIAINVAMWNNGDDNELYILNREHSWGDWKVEREAQWEEQGLKVRRCTVCEKREEADIPALIEAYPDILHGYIQEIPDGVYAHTNLWPLLEPEDGYFYAGTHWGNLDEVVSVTIPIAPGDQIYASSFKQGIRVTFFDPEGVLISISNTDIKAEFEKNGYITVPEGAIAVNIPMWDNSTDNVLKILTLEKADCQEHTFAQWETVLEPGLVSKGSAVRYCENCGYSETAEIPELMMAGSFAYRNGDVSVVLPYRIYYPSQYESNTSVQYPVVLFYHGAGTRGNDNQSQVLGMAMITRLVALDNCIIVAPQCDVDHQWVNTPWGKGSYDSDSVQESHFLDASISLLDEIILTERVDCDRVYVAGQSMGGYATWNVIMEYPEKFAAAIPVCGAADPNRANDVLGVAVWAFHGAEDITVPVSGSRDMITALRALGGINVRYTEYEGVGHASWVNAFAEPELTDWLFSQKRHIHSHTDTVTPPTCTEQGYTTYTCQCGDSYVDDYVDATGHNWSNGICTFCGEGKKPYKRLTYFTVDVVDENGKSYKDNAVLYLPANYTPGGEPVKLVIYCKQGSSQITSSSNPIEAVGFYNYLISLGYAVLGVDGVPDAWRDELGLDNTRVVGNPLAVQGTEKAYDYVIENYNIAADGCFISGYSQGGHYAQNVIDLTDIPILAAAEQSPVCSMQYHQWDLNASVTVNNVKYSKAARLNVARIYGFPAFATNAELLNLAYDNTLVEQYDPWVRNSENIYTGFIQKSNLWYLPEGTSVGDITMTHMAKCPVKIWCAEDDTAISADVMKVFVKAIQNAGGTAEISIAPSGGHGFFQKQTAVGSFTENGKTYNTLPIAVEIADWFAQYGGYEHIHTYENGICTGCGAKEPVSHIPGDITGDGELNNKDVTRLFKYLSGYDVEVDEAALDINGDGEIDNKDLTRLFRYLSGHDVTIY